ncbi:MAG: thioredoxin [Spirochaetes bacterium]|nr:thioredoxin [Spirochaetota bacterium]
MTLEPGRILPSSFADLVSSSPIPVLVDFWAEWCGPCRMVGPTIERLARDYTGRLLTVKVNIDRRPQVAERYEVQSIPTIMLFWQGEPVMRLLGAQAYESIKREIEKFLPPPAAAGR